MLSSAACFVAKGRVRPSRIEGLRSGDPSITTSIITTTTNNNNNDNSNNNNNNINDNDDNNDNNDNDNKHPLLPSANILIQ